MIFDSRITPIRRDLASATYRAIVKRKKYVNAKPATVIYTKPDIKSATKGYLSFNSLVEVIKIKGKYSLIKNLGWCPIQDLVKVKSSNSICPFGIAWNSWKNTNGIIFRIISRLVAGRLGCFLYNYRCHGNSFIDFALVY